MNTPEPCVLCENLYVDCMYKDDPNYSAECKEGLSMGHKDCPEYKLMDQGLRDVNVCQKYKAENEKLRTELVEKDKEIAVLRERFY